MQRIQFIFYALLSFILASCSSDDGTVISDGETYSLSFSCDVQGYNDSGSRASAVSISSGAKMYVVLKSGSSVVNYGTATYSGGSWELVTNATPSEGSGDAVLYYFENPKSTSSSSVTCSANTAVYSCTGSWSFSSNTLSVSGTLTPQMSRIRFYGSSSTSFSVSKVTVPSSFSISNGTLSTMTSSQSVTISSSRYSDYVYADPATLQNLVVTVSGTDYTKDALPSGDAIKSIVVDLPTSSSHAGWSVVGGADSEEPEYEPEPIDTHEAVDLGLSVKWATCNVGANNPEDYGDYYAWGEIETKSDYSWGTYLDSPNRDGKSFTKYATGKKTQLDIEDDVAHVKWGGSWRMPTKAEMDELRTKCTWTWTTQDGVKGYVVTGPNGKSIFLPAAGYRGGSSLYDTGSYGQYWLSSLLLENNSIYAYILYFIPKVKESYFNRYCGLSVRPVCP